jgi:hypothetical protein
VARLQLGPKNKMPLFAFCINISSILLLGSTSQSYERLLTVGDEKDVRYRCGQIDGLGEKRSKLTYLHVIDSGK